MFNFDSSAALPRLLTDSDAAHFLQLKPQTLRVWRSQSRKKGRIVDPAWVKIGSGRAKKPRYTVAALLAYSEAQAVVLQAPKRCGRPRKAEGSDGR